MEEIYRIENLNFTYPGEEKPALSGMSFCVKAGAFVLVCGDSGSGKSTLLRQLKKIHMQAGFVGQDPEAQIVCDTVYDELVFGLEQTGRSKRFLGELCGYFGLTKLLDRKTDSLSGGEKQLVNLAAVTALKPDIILLDEPAASLDPVSRSSFYSIVRRLNRELGITVILCEHDCQDVLEDADQILFLQDGRCISSAFDVSLVKCPLIQLGNMIKADPVPLRISSLRERFREREAMLEKRAAPAFHPGETAFWMKNVFYKYTKSGPCILNGLDLQVSKGSIMALAGGNGAGKTTLLKIMAGIYRPFSGKCKGASGRYLPQDAHKAFLLDIVEDDFRDYMKNTGILPETMKEFPGYYDLYCRYRKRNIYDLSGGEVQRLAVYKLLLGKPELLLLDEPTKGLDYDCKEELGRMLQELAEQGMAIVVSTHDMEFTGAFCKEAVFLFDGRVSAPCPAAEFLGEHEFYTTAAVRALRDCPRLKGAVSPKDLFFREGSGDETSC